MDIPKKHWWVIAIVVPILIAIIGIIPKLIPGEKPSQTDKPFYVEIAGSQFNGQVAFNTVNIISQQVQLKQGVELTKNSTDALRKALELVRSKNYTDAIPAFEAVANTTPVPAVYNNLGAAYLAVGNKEKAVISFNKALAMKPGEQSASFNLEQTNNPIEDKNNPSPASLQAISKEQEPNNTIFQPNPFEIGNEVSGNIENTKDRDFFKFQYNGKLRDKISIRMESRSITLRPHVTIYNKDKSEINHQHKTTYGASLEIIIASYPRSEYYLRILPYDGNGEYKLIVVPQHSYDHHEPNDDQFSATKIGLGQTISANIMDTHDSDWYQLNGISTEKTTVRMENQSTSLKPHVTVYNKDKSEINHQHKTTWGSSLEFSFKSDPGSTYYLRILPYDGHGKYQLSVK